uniref:Retrotransposon protein, putative, unclassified n=1 Tax=Oryza sativa subsp. japonica TaxID=39947 RepID=Q2R2A0_ORYSJ|nr:retrotransposon protein, putative, unclassified [Oryza sativa Japonica Group]
MFIFHLLLPSSSRWLQLLLLFLLDGIRKDASKQQVVAPAAPFPVGVGELLPNGLGDPRRGGPCPVTLAEMKQRRSTAAMGTEGCAGESSKCVRRSASTSGQTLRMKGFSPKWCEWIASFIQGGHVGIKVNDQTGNNFQTYKGLRQGDPLSPILFNIVADMLTLLIKRAKDVDDTIIFLEHDLQQEKNLKLILSVFEKLSGLKINFHKSELFCFGHAKEFYDQYSNIFGCLMKVKDTVLHMGSWIVNDGNQTRFWEDKWLGNLAFKDKYPSLYSIVRRKSSTIANVMSSVPLNVSFRRSLVGNIQGNILAPVLGKAAKV